MRPFHEKFQGRVMLGRIMSAGNVSWEKLPVLDRYINQHKRKNYLCYNHVLGICGHRNCRFQHATAAEIPNDFAHQLCATLRPGMDYILRTENPAPLPVGSGGRGSTGGTSGGIGAMTQGKHGRQGTDNTARTPKQAKTDA